MRADIDPNDVFGDDEDDLWDVEDDEEELW